MPTLRLPVPADLRPWVLNLRIDEVPAGTLNRFPAMVEGLVVVIVEGIVATLHGPALQGPRGLLAGPRSVPMTSLTVQRLRTVSALLHPAAVARLAGCAAQQLRDLQVDLADLWPAAWSTALQRLAQARRDRERVAVLLDVLRRQLAAGGPDTRARALALYRHTALPLRTAASRLGWSERHTERLFLAELGLTPKQFQRVQRFEQTLLRALQAPAMPLAELAVAGGYADQAHMSHEFRRLSGEAPGQLLQRLRANDPEHWPIVHGWQFAASPSPRA